MWFAKGVLSLSERHLYKTLMSTLYHFTQSSGWNGKTTVGGFNSLRCVSPLYFLTGLFFLTRLTTDSYLEVPSFQQIKQWLTITFQFGEYVSYHINIVDPEHQDIVHFSGFFCDGINKSFELRHHRNLCYQSRWQQEVLVSYYENFSGLFQIWLQLSMLASLRLRPIHFGQPAFQLLRTILLSS